MVYCVPEEPHSHLRPDKVAFGEYFFGLASEQQRPFTEVYVGQQVALAHPADDDCAP